MTFPDIKTNTRKRKKREEKKNNERMRRDPLVSVNMWVDVMSVQLLNTRGYFNNLMSVNSNFKCKL